MTTAENTSTAQPTVVKSNAEWRRALTAMQYHITCEHGTEHAFTGPFWDEKRSGAHCCVGCGAPLFASATKFDSGTGWPRFFAPVAGAAITEHQDRSLFLRRTAVRWVAQDAHLGHVFRDGPKPTGLRCCINGNALAFTAEPDK